MEVSPLAGKPAQPSMLLNVPKLIAAYYTETPDPSVPAQRVVFGTSGHRGSAFERSFNERHILAMTQARFIASSQPNSVRLTISGWRQMPPRSKKWH